MDVLYLILLIIAALAFAVAAFYTPRVPGDAPVAPVSVMARVNLVSLGLLAWVLVALIQQIDSMS